MNIWSSSTCEVIIKVQLAVLTINGFCFQLTNKVRERYKVRKKKKMQKILHLGFLIPPPPNAEKYNLFFLSFWHHSEQLWKNSFFPLEKVQKRLRIFSENWSSEGAWPPSQREKFFFAFLDELDHSTHFLKNAENWPRSEH